MLEAAKPLMKWIAENAHPHTTAIVDSMSVTLMESVARSMTQGFVKD